MNHGYCGNGLEGAGRLRSLREPRVRMKAIGSSDALFPLTPARNDSKANRRKQRKLRACKGWAAGQTRLAAAHYLVGLRGGRKVPLRAYVRSSVLSVASCSTAWFSPGEREILKCGSGSQCTPKNLEALHELLMRRKAVGSSDALFPLTPTLSRGEREMLSSGSASPMTPTLRK